MQSLPFAVSGMQDFFIQKWLAARQQYIVALHQLCNFRPFNQNADHSNLNHSLQAFCALLVDYIAMGHFEAFEKIAAVVEQGYLQPAQIPQHLIHSLLGTTLAVLDFNDKYQINSDLSELEMDLCRLTEKMAQRLEWEDKLIKIYQSAKQEVFPAIKTA
ncbi:MAG: Rsd/AlgQ family anti-sigma factor [Candidatus Berkiellales bacterium]